MAALVLVPQRRVGGLLQGGGVGAQHLAELAALHLWPHRLLGR
jgi:hypothetical protein